MRQSRALVAALVALLSTAVLAGTLVAAPSAEAAGRRSVMTYLAADRGFDRTGTDFDVTERFIKAIRKENPATPLRVLYSGRTRVTAFLPNDTAWRNVVEDGFGVKPRSEREAYAVLRERLRAGGASLAGIEAVLVSYVVVGRRLNARTLRKLDGRVLTTTTSTDPRITFNRTVTLRVDGRRLKLVYDGSIQNPRVVGADRNSGNRQLVHAINRVS